MLEFIEKIDAFLESLQDETVWGYIQSVLGKIRAVLVVEKKDDAIAFWDALVV